MVNGGSDKPFKKGDWWFRVCKSKTESGYIAYAKKEPFIYNGLNSKIFAYEPGELWFKYGETWHEAFLSLFSEVSGEERIDRTNRLTIW